MKGRKLVGLGVLAVLLVVSIVLGGRWVHYRLTHAITNAVFVESDTFTKVAFKRVAGRIEELYREEGDRVRKGEPLAKLEDQDYRLKLKELKNQIGRLDKEIEALILKAKFLREEIGKSIEVVEKEARAIQEKIESLRVKVGLLEKDRERFRKLFSKGVVPSRKFEDVDTALRSLKREIESLKAKRSAVLARKDVLRAKLKQVGEIDKRIEALKKQKSALKSKEEDLENLLQETVLRSPVEGYVVKRFVSEGEVVRQGQFIYAVYDPTDLYILVLLEETKLQGVREGNDVIISIDALPGVKYRGKVKEINRATAAKFAVIPRDITAGEFTKVAQRIPVKVEITEGDKSLLRVGMGGEVAIEKR